MIVNIELVLVFSFDILVAGFFFSFRFALARPRAVNSISYCSGCVAFTSAPEVGWVQSCGGLASS